MRNTALHKVRLLAVLLGLVCQFSFLHAETEVSGPQNGIWAATGSPYILTGSVTVPAGQTLTIEPGCVIESSASGGLFVNGTLIANGTSTDSIYFKGKPSNGYYGYSYGRGIEINNGSAGSSISFMSIDSTGTTYCPYYCYYYPAIRADAPLNITNSSIRNSGYYSLQAGKSNVTVIQCSFSSQNQNYQSIYISSDTISPTIQNCTFSGDDNARTIYANAGSLSNVTNNDNAIVNPYGNVNRNSKWLPAGPTSAFKLTGTISINNDKTLIIQPGCKVLMPYYSYFNINGTLIANGTAMDSIQFIKQQVNSGYNYGGYFNIGSSSANSSFSYVSMDSLGYSSYPITATRSFSITNSSIRNSSSNFSIYISADTISPTIQNCTFSGSDNSRTIFANAGSISNVSNNTDAIIELFGSIAQNSSWQKPGFNSKYKLGGVTVNTSKTLTVQPGCVIESTVGGGLFVNGTLIANGTANDSIYFKGKYLNGYYYGRGIEINSSSAGSSISFLSMDSVGTTYCPYYCYYYPAVLANGQLNITNSSIRNSGYYSLQAGRSNVVTSQCNFGSQNQSYQSIYIPSDTISPTIQNCTFTGNDYSRSIYANAGSITNISDNKNATVELYGNISQNSNWQKPGPNSKYKLNFVTVNTSKTLTIQPGCIIESTISGGLIVNGMLIANGTANDSIYFKGKYLNGYYYGRGIEINSVSTSNNSISFMSMDSVGTIYCPYYCSYYPAVLANASLNITNSSIRNSGYYALQVGRSSIMISQCSFNSQNQNYQSIYINPDTISPTIQNCTFSGSDNSRTIYANAGSLSNVSGNTNAIIYPFGSVNQNSQWAKQGINSVFQISNVTISNFQKLTIQPGCKVQIPYNGYFNVNGTLIANGTTTDSIQFVRQVLNGVAYGGNFNINTSSVNSSFSYVAIDSLGYSGYPINATKSFLITNSSIKNTGTSYSIYISSDTISPTIQDCIFSGSDNSRTIYANAGSVSNISNNTNAIVELFGNVAQNSSWQKPGLNSKYKINGITVNTSKTLTIQPGCIIEPTVNGGLIVNGTLIANGTATDSIYFKGKYANGFSYGRGIEINNSSTASNISFLSMDSIGTIYCSYYCYYYPSILANASLNITNSSIRNSGYYALQVGQSNVSVNHCSFSSQSQSYQSVYVISDTISPTIINCTFNGSDNGRSIYANAGDISNIYNNTNAIVELYGSITQNSSWQKPGTNSKYKLDGITVNASKVLTIEPGCIIETTVSAGLIVNGTLIANGTATDSIYFKGKSVSSSYLYGRGIELNSNSTANSISYMSMDSIGTTYCPYYCSYYPAVLANAPLKLTNSSIRNSSYYSLQAERSSVSVNQCAFSSQNQSSQSIYITSDTISPTIQNCTFSGNDNGKTVYAPSKSFSLITNNTNSILRPTGNINANTVWPKQSANSYYQLDNSITINPGNVLTIEPGNVINFPYYYSYLSVNGTLRAQGTETAVIQFLKIAGTGSAGINGGGVFLNSNSTNHVLSYCTFDKLGGYNNSSLEVSTSDASLSNLSISNSSAYGIQVSGASPTITSSNITSNPYGVYCSSGKPVFNNCNIFANTNYGIYNASGATADTVDARNCYWGDASGPKHNSLNPLGLGNPVTDRVKFNPWKTQPANGQIVDMGVNAILKPVTGCSLTSADTVRVKLTNYGNIVLANFPVSYRINSGTPITETVAASLLPGSSQEYTFTQKANLSTPGTYNIQVYTKAVSDSVPGNDTAAISIEHLAGVNAPANLLPANDTTNLNIPITLNWGAVPDVETYDLYIWKATLTAPITPTVASLTQISYTVSTSLLQYGTAYNWKVASKRSNCRAESVVQTFTTRQLPDLVVDSISVPPTATSETDITIRWRVKNIGSGGTGSTQWYDVVYISDQPVLGTGNDVYVGQLPNFGSLNAGESYPNPLASITYRIPQGWQGNYFVIIKTNSGNSLTEVIDTNNRRTSLPINISLTPPPDLQVTNLVVNPSTAFSEDSITVNYTVQNPGSGPTTATNWSDVVFLSKDTALNINTATYLMEVPHAAALASNGNYNIVKRVKLPAQISGTYYVHVFTDRYNQVFEYVREDNNTRRSLPMNIILRPAPNLIVSNLSVSGDTVSGSQPISLQWATRNEGSATAKPSWYEAIYYSTSSTFNASTAINISGITRTDSIVSLGSIAGQATIQLPASLAEGSYYFFVKTDAYNQVFESTGENDNVSTAAGPVTTARPDLKPVTLTAPATTTSEQTIAVAWAVSNSSNAAISNTSWYDGIYLSTDTILNNGDIALGGQAVNQLLPAGAGYNRQANVVLPQGISGSYYLLVVTDRDNAVYEKLETNNLIYQPITITLAPWPDLQVSAITVPAADTVGSVLQLQYTVQNIGTGAILNKTITDYVYLSFFNNVNTGSLTMIGSVSQNRSLNSGSSYTQAVSFTIPTSLSAGTYYVIVVTDATGQVYENTGENNNKNISAGIAMTNVPPIDLSVTAGQLLSSTVTAGQTASLQYSVKNNSINATVISSWQDAVYLSNNPILDASDILLSTYNINGPLNAGASYTQPRTVNIPNGVSGTLYLLVHTDKNNVHTDPNRGNNTLSINNGSGGPAIVVTVPPPADLVVPAISAPSTAIAAQPYSVDFTIKNNGTGSTPASSWGDNAYLSTDYVLDYSDVYLGSATRNGVLTSGNQYTGTIATTIPANLSGNYILIVKADGNNSVYEPNKNNNLAFSNVFISAQAPSDLVVAEINLPLLSQSAGSPFTVEWKLKNRGSNTASGYTKDAVYLSADTLLDASDVLFGTLDGYIGLPTGATLTRQLTKTLTGISPGSYYVLVKTDILNNIVEQNDSNNVKYSDEPVSVTIKELLVNILQPDTLLNNTPLYYRMEIPASLAGETMSIKLSGDLAHNAINRLFVRYALVPNSNQYDVVADVPFSANQEAIIPSLRAGTYYLMALGTNTSTTLQNIGLLAKTIPFAITAVDAPKGGNTGAVTLKITGAKFEPATTFILRKGNTRIFPAQVYYINQTHVFATYNLLNTSLGLYDIVAKKANSDSTSLLNSFEVVQGPGSTAGTGSGSPGSGTGFVCQITNIGFEDNLQTDIIAPPSVRRSTTAVITVQFENTGSVDIPTPVRYFLSLQEKIYIGFSIADLAQKNKDLKLECRETGGPPDILRPGAKGFFKIYFNVDQSSFGTVDFMITE